MKIRLRLSVTAEQEEDEQNCHQDRTTDNHQDEPKEEDHRGQPDTPLDKQSHNITLDFSVSFKLIPLYHSFNWKYTIIISAIRAQHSEAR